MRQTDKLELKKKPTGIRPALLFLSAVAQVNAYHTAHSPAKQKNDRFEKLMRPPGLQRKGRAGNRHKHKQQCSGQRAGQPALRFPEPAGHRTIPRQYTEAEMRRLENKRRQSDDDDDTI